jgi:hypothetical protein
MAMVLPVVAVRAPLVYGALLVFLYLDSDATHHADDA